MHEKDINKFIGYGVAVIVIYYIVSNLIGYIIWVVIGMVAWKIYRDRRRF